MELGASVGFIHKESLVIFSSHKTQKYLTWNYANSNRTIEIKVAEWPAKGRKMTSVHFLCSIALQFLSFFLRVNAGVCSGVWYHILGLDDVSGKAIRPVPLKTISSLANIQPTTGNIVSCPQFCINVCHFYFSQMSKKWKWKKPVLQSATQFRPSPWHLCSWYSHKIVNAI